MTDTHAVERLRDSVTDGRTENIRYRQNQLQSLHAALRSEADALCGALAQDARASSAEVETEFYLTMDAVRHFYDALDFDAEHKQEYLPVTEGRDNATRRVGVGLVVIRPTTHTRLYSIVTPLAAAISAGNCVILEVCKKKKRPDPGSPGKTLVLTLSSRANKPAQLAARYVAADRRRAPARINGRAGRQHL